MLCKRDGVLVWFLALQLLSGRIGRSDLQHTRQSEQYCSAVNVLQAIQSPLEWVEHENSSDVQALPNGGQILCLRLVKTSLKSGAVT